MRKKGFTLIEMLIVIAVIGILAIAVLSAINPVEQTRKARDARRRSNAAELLNAAERYYTTYEENSSVFSSGVYDADDGDLCSAIISADGYVTPAKVAELVASDELKVEFTNRLVDDSLFAGVDTDTELIRVCYQIESRANLDTISECLVGTATYSCLPE